MRRLTILIPLSLAVSLGPACEVGDVRDPEQAAAEDGAVGDSTAGEDASLADPQCVPAAAPNGNGNHNAGLGCIAGNCHDGAGQPPLWTLAGTLFLDKNSTTGVAGATMIFTDANGEEISLITASNGNFYTGDPIAFPIKAKASRCPNSLSMTDEITEAMANCNQAGCHVTGNRTYLPE